MTNYAGYMGKVIHLDLGSRSVSEYPWTDRDRRLYLGGKAMASKIMYDTFTGSEKPLEPENIIVISTGPLTGTGAPSSSRFNISTLSPQTGITTSSNCGGNFGHYLKKAGYDALIISGKCEKLTWVEIHNDIIKFHDAQELKGLCTTPTQESIQQKLDEERGCEVKCGKVVIGPAGENLVKYASVFSNERAAGRAGVGCVFGSKNLKGIAVSGTHEVSIYDPQKTHKLFEKWVETLKKHPLTGNQLPKMGTAGLVTTMQMRGLLSTRNYAKGQFEDFELVNGETLAEDINIVNKGCLSCPMKCARTVKVGDHEVKGPELETLGLLGGGIMNNDLKLICKWNYELDELGMDTISCASTVAWAMEANEKGLWKNGLQFGKTANLSAVFRSIANRQGIGNELAEGTRTLSNKYGGKEFAIQSKGLELAAYEPRKAVGQGLGYAVSNRGGCHLNGGYLVILEGLGLNVNSQTPHAKADLCMLMQDLMESVSSGGQCLFTSYALFPSFLLSGPNSFITRTVNAVMPYIGPAVRLINKYPRAIKMNLPLLPHTYALKYAVGMKMDLGRFIRIGERSYNVERAVNAKFGVNASCDTLPKRLTDVPQDPKDPKTKVPLETMKKTYYKARGWGSDGLPGAKKLQKLEIASDAEQEEAV